MRKVSLFNTATILVGMAFLYLPIAILVIYSFNDSTPGHGLGRVVDAMVRRTFL